MKNIIINHIIRFRRIGIVQIGHKTLVSLFPFIMLAAITRIIGDSVFSSKEGMLHTRGNDHNKVAYHSSLLQNKHIVDLISEFSLE